MKSRPIFPLSSCSSSAISRKTPMKRIEFSHCIVLIGAILSVSNATQAAQCLNDIAGFTGGNICTAEDVKLTAGSFTVINPPPSCVRGSMFNIQLQANLEATAQNRYNTGIWIAQDGGNALNGDCFADYLPPLLSLAPVPVAGVESSPFLEANIPPNIIGGCGDLDQNFITQRNIGGTTAPGPVGPPAVISIKCEDSVQPDPLNPGEFLIGSDGIADVAACLSWSNNQNVTPAFPACTSQADTIPSTKSKCNCATANIAPIVVVECDATHPCVAPDACTTATCVAGTCVEAPVVCTPTNNCFTAECVLPTGCVETPLVCDNPNVCQQCVAEPPPNPNVCGTCVPSQIGPPTCTYPNVLNGTACDGANHVCEDGMCVPTGLCETAANCPCPPDCLTVACVEGTCIYSAVADGTTCGAVGEPPGSPEHNVCISGVCEQCLIADNCSGADLCNIAACSPNTHTCSYSHPDCSVGGTACSVDCCEPDVGCVHTPSDNNCLDLEDECNLGFCGPNGCETDPLVGDLCGNPANCNTGICVLGANNIATCQITETCTAPDTCSTASCDGAGRCTISSRCACPEFCNNAIPTGSCVQCDQTHPCPDSLICESGVCVGCETASDCSQGGSCVIASCIDHRCHFRQDPECEEECSHNDHGHGGGFINSIGAIPGLPVPVPVPVPAPVPAPVTAPVLTPVAVPGPGAIAPVDASPNGAGPNSAIDSSAGEIKDHPASSSDNDKSSSCATTGGDGQGLWQWLVILALVFSIKKRMRAQVIID